jgi:hypothetical protein
MKNLPPGAFIVGNKIYCKCDDCGSLVQLNKLIFGDLHLCLTEEELEKKERYDIWKKKSESQ